MPDDLTLSAATLFSFVLVLCRTSFVFVFVPLPGLKNMADAPKIVFSLCVSIALFPFWPHLPEVEITFGRMLTWILSEAALGLMIGLIVAFLTETFVMAAQLLSVQAGYSYASTIDPTTQADSGVLPITIQLLAGFLFFTLGLDRLLVKALAGSLGALPPGVFNPAQASLDLIRRLGASMFSTGLQLAMPVIALLMLVDVALALLGRIATQLQLLTLAFPIKMLGTLAALSMLVGVIPAVYEKAAARSFEALNSLLK